MKIENFLKNNSLALSLLAMAFTAPNLLSAEAAQTDGCGSSGCKSKAINQKLIDKHNGLLVLCRPGSYHLEQDITGTIQITASNVCLDLCCHEVDAGGRANAIIVGDVIASQKKQRAVQIKEMIYTKEKAMSNFLGKAFTQMADSKTGSGPKRTLKLPIFEKRATRSLSLPLGNNIHHVRVSNGSITGAAIDGVLVNGIFDLGLSNITMQRNALNAISILDSNVVSVDGVNSFGGGLNPIGERAIRMISTDNFDMKNLTITGYTCTVGSAIELEDCHTGTIASADISLNISKPSEKVFFTPLGSFITLTGSDAVTLNKVNVNNNRYQDLGITFFGIFLAGSSSCAVVDCGVSGNIDESTADDASFDGLFFAFSDNCRVNGFAFNANKTINYRFNEFDGILVSNSSSLVCENVQISENVANDISWFAMHGIWTIDFFEGPPTSDVTMRNCSVTNNATNGSSDGVTSYIGIRVNSSDNLLENCRMDNNKGFTEAAQFIQGFACSGGTNTIRVFNSQANLNDAPDTIDFFAFPGTAACVGYNCHAGNVELINCSACDNGNAGVLSYNDIYIQCINCVFKGNGTVGKKIIGAGTAFGVPAFGSSAHAVVKNGIFQQNGSFTTTQEAYGIYVNPGDNNSLLIENTDIVESQSSSVAAGIFADSALNVILDKVTVKGIQAPDCSGVHLAHVENAVVKNSIISATGTGAQLFVSLLPPLLSPIPAVLTDTSLPATSALTGVAGLADPLNACSTLTNDLSGKIGVLKWSEPSCDGSATRVERCIAAGDIATIIVQPTPPLEFTGSAAQVNCSVSEADGDALIDKITSNTGLELSIGYLPTQSGVGIKFEGVNVFEISETTTLSNLNGGFVVLDSSNGVVQESKALSNGGAGFSDNQADPAKLNAYIRNVASKNNPNYSVGANVTIDNISIN